MDALKGLDVIGYWRRSLIDGDKKDITDAKSHIKVNIDDVLSGQLNGKATENLKAAYIRNEQDKTKNQNGKSTQSDIVIPVALQVQVSLLTLSPIFDHGETKNNSGPASIINAIANVELSTGKLHPISDQKPWVSRKSLSPLSGASNGSDIFVIGKLKDADDFLTKTIDQDILTWEDLISYRNRLFLSLNGVTIEQFTSEKVAQSETGYLLYMPEDTGKASPNRNILYLYNELLDSKIKSENNKLNPLLESLIEGFSSIQGKRQAITLQASLVNVRHSGQMSPYFPAADSQRVAISESLNSTTGDNIAVNGPPGTGKTTLLQSVIASMYINSILDNDSSPPVIVAASTNNQAVTNIISSFANSIDEEDRWIPLKTLGLYLCSSGRVKDITDPNTIYGITGYDATVLSGNVSNIFSDDFKQKAKLLLLERSGFATVKKARDHQKSIIEENIAHMKAIFATIEALHGFIDFEGYVADISGKEEELGHAIALIREDVALHVNCLKRITKAHHQQPIVRGLFKWIPSVHRKIAADIIEDADIDERVSDGLMTSIFDAEIKGGLVAITDLLNSIINDKKSTIQVYEHAKKALLDLKEITNTQTFTGFEYDNSQTLIHNLKILLDVHFRYSNFIAAVHYWEATWIDSALPDPTNRKEEADMWGNLAMIMPCFVSTLAMLPSFFRYRTKPFYPPSRIKEGIDLLIIDEAGQVTPEQGGAAFALAKKSLVVGDTMQIQPVVNIDPGIDIGNLRATGIQFNGNQLNAYSSKGFMSASGSVMAMTKTSCKVQEDGRDGVMLTEHYRCPPSIIEYCNGLAYNNELIAKTKDISDPDFPMMGFAHVDSVSLITPRGSRINQGQVIVVADWLHRNRERIESAYCDDDQTAEDVVAIVTPFKAQSELAMKALKEKGFNTDVMVTGTVHRLQGAERPLVIFLPTYSQKDGGMPFIDSGPNMLNVAVSRAKKSFLVFGDMRLMNPLSEKPSGQLARHLFASDENEITDIDLTLARKTFTDPTLSEENVHHISTLDGHLGVLYRAIDTAQKQLKLVSPYLTEFAIKFNDEKLIDLIKEAVGRGVTVEIYVDHGRKTSSQTIEGRAKALNCLTDAGATVYGIHNIHNKTLIRDDNLLVEGSFNWLSAGRMGRFVNKEKSISTEQENCTWIINKIDNFVIEFDAELNEIESKQWRGSWTPIVDQVELKRSA